MLNAFRLTVICSLLSVFTSLADAFEEAEQAFVHEINAMEGIELVGGPFSVAERYVFGGASGYFVIAPAVRVPGLDQRLSVQTRAIERDAAQPASALPTATPDGSGSALDLADRNEIVHLLARRGFGERREEVTLMGDGSAHVREVNLLPLLKLTATSSSNAIALLGLQSWQGVPLYLATFERPRGNFDLEVLREGFVPRRGLEIQWRPFPVFSPQTFFAQPGLAARDWPQLLASFSRIDLGAAQILDVAVGDRTVTIKADPASPVLPYTWVKLEKKASEWTIEGAIELRAEFPRPGAWWSFLPLLPTKEFVDRFTAAESEVTAAERSALGSIAQRLRGVGQVSAFALVKSAPARTIRVRTTHSGWRGYDLNFTELGGAWRLNGFLEWAE